MKKLIVMMGLALALAPAAAALADPMAGMDMSKPMASTATAKTPAKAKPAKKAKPAAKAEAKQYWTCSMHPEIHLDHPGKCPKCGMDLVKEAKAQDKK